MTSKEIEKIIKTKIAGRLNSSFIQKGTYILLEPFKDILGGFCFERSGFDKNSIYLWWFVQPLYVPINMIHLTHGNRLENNGDQVWHNLYSDETLHAVTDGINDKISLVESLTEPVSFYTYFNNRNSHKSNLRLNEALIYTLIWNEAPNWKREVKVFLNSIDNFDISIPWISKIKNEILNISLSDNPKLILENNKRDLIKILKL